MAGGQARDGPRTGAGGGGRCRRWHHYVGGSLGAGSRQAAKSLRLAAARAANANRPSLLGDAALRGALSRAQGDCQPSRASSPGGRRILFRSPREDFWGGLANPVGRRRADQIAAPRQESQGTPPGGYGRPDCRGAHKAGRGRRGLACWPASGPVMRRRKSRRTYGLLGSLTSNSA